MARIGEIAEQNPWWKHGENFPRFDSALKKAEPLFFKRKAIELTRGNIYMLRGPRQVGKTTYIKDNIRKLLEAGIPPNSILYLSLDFFTSRREMRNAISYFLDSTRDSDEIYIFLDEITSIDDWNLELKYLSDQGVSQKSVIFTTGSNAVKLKEKGELLPGRGLEGNAYYIKPLSFREFALQSSGFIRKYIQNAELRDGIKNLNVALQDTSLNISADIDDMKKQIQRILPFKKDIGYLFDIYLMTGGFPGVIDNYLANKYIKNDEKIEPSVSEIFVRNILGDISRLQKNETIVRQILQGIVARYGSRYTFSQISKDIGRTHITTQDYLTFLEDSFICFVLYSYDFNKKTPKWKGDKKVYFFDPFIFYSIKSFLTGENIWDIITKAKQDEELQSKIVEGLAVSLMLSHREIPFLKSAQTFLWFYYDKKRKEIDLIVKGNGDYSGIEVKYRTSIKDIAVKHIDPVKQYIILSKEEFMERENIIVVPIDVFLSLLPCSNRNL